MSDKSRKNFTLAFFLDYARMLAMNVINATAHIFKYFETNDSFNLSDDFQKLFPNHISETPEADKAAVIIALEESINSGICRKATIKKEDYYLLIRPIEQFNQTVSISYITVQWVSNILSKASEQLKDKSINFDPLRIEEKDILLALTILGECASNNQEKQ